MSRWTSDIITSPHLGLVIDLRLTFMTLMLAQSVTTYCLNMLPGPKDQNVTAHSSDLMVVTWMSHWCSFFEDQERVPECFSWAGDGFAVIPHSQHPALSDGRKLLRIHRLLCQDEQWHTCLPLLHYHGQCELHCVIIKHAIYCYWSLIDMLPHRLTDIWKLFIIPVH